MYKWNMIIDVAECTNCNLCTLSAMDEYVGNDWPGYTTAMPRRLLHLSPLAAVAFTHLCCGRGGGLIPWIIA